MSRHDEFAGDWLSLREPADHAARSADLARHLAEHLAPRGALSIIDLGAGHGSNLRWLAPRLNQAQYWRLVDRDAGLLAKAQNRPLQHPAGCDLRLETTVADLADSSLHWIAEADLVTASAFFDLVSAAWIQRLVRCCAAASTACLFALSVDGRWGFLDADQIPVDDKDDHELRDLFNRHQRRDKGLGAALGPAAPGILSQSLTEHGYAVCSRKADWQLPAGQAISRSLGSQLLQGWRQAALEQSPEQAERIERWHRRRQSALHAGKIGLTVGHCDVLALPQQ